MDIALTPLNCKNPPLKYAAPGRTPPIGGALPVVRKLKVVMEILGVLMVATAGLMAAHFFAIVKRFIRER